MKRFILSLILIMITGFSNRITGQSPYLDISPNSQNVSESAGSTTFSVNVNVGWSVTDDAAWLTAVKTDGSTITVTYEENTSINKRTANITATGTGGVNETVTLTQAGKIPYIDVTPDNQDVCGSASSTSFTVDANVGWSVTDDAAWLTAVKEDGITIMVDFEENNTTHNRTANITVTGTGGVTETVTVNQKHLPYIIVTPREKNVGSASGSTTISVITLGNWYVSDDASWLTATKSNDSIMSISYDENTSTSERTAIITVTETSGMLASVEVLVYQAGASPYLNVTPNSQDVGASAGSTTFSVSTNVEWSVTDDATWLTATKTHGSNISIIYDENTSSSERTAHIIITGTGRLSETVTMTQAATLVYLYVSPGSRTVGPLAGSTTFGVSTNFGWSVSDDADWLTATKIDGSTISVLYGENPDPYNSRTANITVNGSEGKTEIVTLTQVANVNTWFIAPIPTSKNVSSEPGTTTFSISTNLQWSVTDDASWLIATKSNDSIMSVTYEGNSSTSDRTATIAVTGVNPGGGSDPTVICTVTQAGSVYLDVSPNNQRVNAEAGSTTFTVSANVGWSVTDDEDWLTATKTDGSTITVTYDANNISQERTAHITATGTGGVTETFTLTQTPFPYIVISPADRNVGSAPGSTTFSVSTDTDGDWNVTNDASWLTAKKSNDSTVSVTYDENNTGISRTANITVSETSFGVFGTVSVNQSEISSYLDVSPNSKSVDSGAASTIFSVSTNVAWSVSDDADWLTATKTDATTITVNYDENTSANDRTANITATGTGGFTETVTLTQKNSFLEIYPDNRDVSAASGSTTFSVNTNLDWRVSEDTDWLTATKTDGNTITVTFDENTSGIERIAWIEALSDEGGISASVTVTQAGTFLYLNVSLKYLVVGPWAGSTTFTVNSNVEWSVVNDADWLTVTKTDASTILVGYDTNASTDLRTASFTVTGTGGVTDTVTIIQESEYIYFDVEPDSKTVSAEPGSTTFTVSTNIEPMEWMIENDAPWLTAIQTQDSIISISYEANPWTLPRIAHITAFVIYAEVNKTVRVIQDGAPAYLEVSPDTINVGFEMGYTTFTVISNIEWSMNENAEWLSITMISDTLVSVNYEENPDAEDRTAIINLSGEGVSSTDVFFEQSGYFVDAMIDLPDNKQITIYPNPSAGKIFLRNGAEIDSETTLALFNNSGKLLYSYKFDKILAGEIIGIDISEFKHGFYIMQLKNSKFVFTDKITKY